MASNPEDPAQDGEESAPVQWGTVNTVSDEARSQAQRASMRRRRPQRPSVPNLPVGDGGLDVPIKSHRSYGGFFVLLVAVIGICAALYFLAQDGTAFEERVPEIPFAAENLVQQNKVDLTPPPPPPKTLVQFESTPPGAQLVVNGRLLSVPTPTTVQVPVDVPMRVWMRKAGYRTVEQQVVVKADMPPVAFTLEKGNQPTASVELISSPEGAQVTLDGQPMGLTPIVLPKVPADQGVVLRVEKEGYHSHVVLYRLAADEKRNLGVRLTPDRGIRVSGMVHVKSFPSRANVTRLSRDRTDAIGQTGQQPLSFAVPQKQLVHLRATLVRHEPDEALFEIDGPEYTVYLRLAPPQLSYGSVTITGSKKLTVYVDSSELDPLPVKKLKLSTGTHRLTVMDPESRKRKRGEFTVVKDQTVEKSVELVDGEIVIR